jgi:hypothetical protein
MNPALLRVLGLPAAMTAVMIGLIFAVNPGLFGVTGMVGGIVLTALGAVGCGTLFRLTGEDRRGQSDRRSKHGNGESDT